VDPDSDPDPEHCGFDTNPDRPDPAEVMLILPLPDLDGHRIHVHFCVKEFYLKLECYSTVKDGNFEHLSNINAMLKIRHIFFCREKFSGM
jgi:hypothetical protein